MTMLDVDGWPAQTGPEGTEALQFGPEVAQVIRTSATVIEQKSFTDYINAIGISEQRASMDETRRRDPVSKGTVILQGWPQ